MRLTHDLNFKSSSRAVALRISGDASVGGLIRLALDVFYDEGAVGEDFLLSVDGQHSAIWWWQDTDLPFINTLNNNNFIKQPKVWSKLNLDKFLSPHNLESHKYVQIDQEILGILTIFSFVEILLYNIVFKISKIIFFVEKKHLKVLKLEIWVPLSAVKNYVVAFLSKRVFF